MSEFWDSQGYYAEKSCPKTKNKNKNKAQTTKGCSAWGGLVNREEGERAALAVSWVMAELWAFVLKA